MSKLKATQHFLPGNEHADVHPWMSSSENDNGVDIPVYYPYTIHNRLIWMKSTCSDGMYSPPSINVSLINVNSLYL